MQSSTVFYYRLSCLRARRKQVQGSTIAFMVPIVRRPMDYNGMGPGFPPGINNFYQSPYGCGPGRGGFSDAYIRIPRTARNLRERPQRQFGRSYRWGTSLGGYRPRPIQFPFGYPQSAFPGQARHSPFAARMPRYPMMRSPMQPPMRGIHPLPPLQGPRYGGGCSRFGMPTLPRSYAPPRPTYRRYDSYRSYQPDDDDDDENDDVFGEEDDETWGESDIEDPSEWEHTSRSEYDPYEEYSRHRSTPNPYSSYANYSSEYNDYGGDSYSESMYTQPSYGYGGQSSCRSAW